MVLFGSLWFLRLDERDTTMEQPTKDVNKAYQILKLLASDSTYDDVIYQAGVSRATVSKVKKWFNDLRWDQVLTFEEDIQRLRKDYLDMKVDERASRSVTEVQAIDQARSGAVTEHWADLCDMARRMLEHVVIPGPRFLRVFDLEIDRGGEYLSPSGDGHGVQWVYRPGRQIELEFFDFAEDWRLQSDPFFEPLMSHMPEVKMEFQEFKHHLCECIRKSHGLFASIVRDGKQAVVEAVKAKVDDKYTGQFVAAKASERQLLLNYREDCEIGGLIVTRAFFETVYNDSMAFKEYKDEPTDDEYVTDYSSEMGKLWFGGHELAWGAHSDIRGLLDIHKELRNKYGGSPLTKELLDHFGKIRQLGLSIMDKLQTRIPKRTFSGSCQLCPD